MVPEVITNRHKMKEQILMEDQLKQGETLFTNGKIEEAEKCFLNLLTKDAQKVEALNNLGVVNYSKGNVKEAEDYFLKALEIREDYTDAAMSLAVLFQNTKRWQEAVNQLENSIARDDKNPNILNQLGRVYLEMGKIEKARSVISKSLLLNPNQKILKELLNNLEYSKMQTKSPIIDDDQAAEKSVQHSSQQEKESVIFKTKKAENVITQKQISLNNLFSSMEWQTTPQVIQNVVRSLIDQNQKLSRDISIIQQNTLRLSNFAAKRKRNSKLAVFVADIPTSRVAKLAYGLSKTGWQVILLHGSAPWFEEMSFFHEIHHYANPLEALNIAASYNPLVYHVFSNMNFETAATFIRHKPARIVFDDYDLLGGTVNESYGRENSRQIELERFCLENADGLCCRSLDTQIAKHELGYSIRGKRILFPELCWGNIRKEKKPNSQNGTIKFCYVGALRPPGNNESGYHVELAAKLKAILKGRFNYDIYPSKGSEQLITGHREMAKKQQLDGYMNFHSCLPYEKLLSKLPEYDVGVFMKPLNESVRSVIYDLSKKYKYGLANKIFDYIDCGLRILTGPFMHFQYSFINRYWHSLKLEDIDNNMNLDVLEKNNRLAITEHIGKLGLLYKEVNRTT